jgi:hypothetical protein
MDSSKGNKIQLVLVMKFIFSAHTQTCHLLSKQDKRTLALNNKLQPGAEGGAVQ